tara:strand:+ start:5146 stop:5607 length:462 start_codon:yes stop_codon:yes gene_type:complete
VIDESWEDLTPTERQEKIVVFESLCNALGGGDKAGIEPKHYFCNGLYAREIFIPAGVALVGAIHKHSHINVVSQGKIIVATDEGVRTITAPETFVSPAGVKRAGYVFEDTVWTTFHVTDSTEPDDIWQECVADSYEEYNNLLEDKSCHSLPQQ